tara:strand:- start:455 stop:592 length:138 start_codon:yes stop_codon:yes gene_type:complete
LAKRGKTPPVTAYTKEQKYSSIEIVQTSYWLGRTVQAMRGIVKLI